MSIINHYIINLLSIVKTDSQFTCIIPIKNILLGDYEVCVKFNEDHIEGSPFPVTIVDGSPAKSNASKVRAHGRGLTSPKLGPENEFSVDANDAGKF